MAKRSQKLEVSSELYRSLADFRSEMIDYSEAGIDPRKYAGEHKDVILKAFNLQLCFLEPSWLSLVMLYEIDCRKQLPEKIIALFERNDFMPSLSELCSVVGLSEEGSVICANIKDEKLLSDAIIVALLYDLEKDKLAEVIQSDEESYESLCAAEHEQYDDDGIEDEFDQAGNPKELGGE